VDGEMHLDTAVVEEIVRENYPHSRIKGDANVLIFPNLAAGNKEMVNDLVAALRRHIQRGGATAWQKAPPVVDESRISHAR